MVGPDRGPSFDGTLSQPSLMKMQGKGCEAVPAMLSLKAITRAPALRDTAADSLALMSLSPVAALLLPFTVVVRCVLRGLGRRILPRLDGQVRRATA